MEYIHTPVYIFVSYKNIFKKKVTNSSANKGYNYNKKPTHHGSEWKHSYYSSILHVIGIVNPNRDIY